MTEGASNRQSLKSNPAASQQTSDVLDSHSVDQDREFRSRDDVDNDLADSLLHRPGGHRVLGLKLRPYSFWHAALLDWICSPFVGHEADFDLAALWIAARICQLRYPRIPQHTRFEKFRGFYVAWKYHRRAVPISERLNLPLGQKRFTSPFKQELNKFSAYLSDYNTFPIFGHKEGSGESVPLCVPWYLHEVCSLRRFKPRLTKARAWDSCVGESRWDNAGMSGAWGNPVLIQTPADRAAEREAENPDADNRARFDEATNTWVPVGSPE